MICPRVYGKKITFAVPPKTYPICQTTRKELQTSSAWQIKHDNSSILMDFWKYLVYPWVAVSDERLRRCFAGKWVVVTGASSGIGEALTLRLIKAGANLYLISHNEEKLASLCDKARENGCEACYETIDLRQREQLDALCLKLRDRLPSVSYLFCNAGKSINRSIGDSVDRMHDFDRTMDLNYRSMVALTLALLHSLRSA